MIYIGYLPSAEMPYILFNLSSLAFFRSFVCIFAVNREDTCALCEKCSSKLDIFRSLICIFAIKSTKE